MEKTRNYNILACKNLLAAIISQCFVDAREWDPDWNPDKDLIKKANDERMNDKKGYHYKKLEKQRKLQIKKREDALDCYDFLFTPRLTFITQHLDIKNFVIRNAFRDQFPEIIRIKERNKNEKS